MNSTQHQVASAELNIALKAATNLRTHQRNNIEVLGVHPAAWKPHLEKAGVNKAYIKNLMFQVLMARNLMACRVDLAQKNLQMIKDTRNEFGALIFDHAHLLSDKEYQYFLNAVMVHYNHCKDLYTVFKDLHEKGLEWECHTCYSAEEAENVKKEQKRNGWTMSHAKITVPDHPKPK